MAERDQRRMDERAWRSQRHLPCQSEGRAVKLARSQRKRILGRAIARPPTMTTVSWAMRLWQA